MPAAPLCWSLCKVQWQPDKIIAGLITCRFMSEIPKTALFCFTDQRIISLIFIGNRKNKLVLMLPYWLACRNELHKLVKMEGPKNKKLLTHLKQDRKNCDLHWLELAVVIPKFQSAVTITQSNLDIEGKQSRFASPPAKPHPWALFFAFFI